MPLAPRQRGEGGTRRRPATGCASVGACRDRRGFRKPGRWCRCHYPTRSSSGCCMTARRGWRASRWGSPRRPGFRLSRSGSRSAALALAAPALWPRRWRRYAGGGAPRPALARSRHRLRPQRGCRRWRSAAPAAAAPSPRRSRTRASAATEFDLMVVPEHDRLRGPRSVVTTAARCTGSPRRQLAAERRRFPGAGGAAAADPRRADRRLEPGLPAEPRPARRDRRRRLPAASRAQPAARWC